MSAPSLQLAALKQCTGQLSLQDQMRFVEHLEEVVRNRFISYRNELEEYVKARPPDPNYSIYVTRYDYECVNGGIDLRFRFRTGVTRAYGVVNLTPSRKPTMIIRYWDHTGSGQLVDKEFVAFRKVRDVIDYYEATHPLLIN